jgi:hypothetical protein
MVWLEVLSSSFIDREKTMPARRAATVAPEDLEALAQGHVLVIEFPDGVRVEIVPSVELLLGEELINVPCSATCH